MLFRSIGGSQEQPGTFSITTDIINTLKTKNKTIRFKIFIQCRAQYQDGPTTFKVTLGRREAYESYRGGFYDGAAKPVLSRLCNAGEYPVFYMEYVLDPYNDMFDKDRYEVQIVSGNPAWVLSDGCFWDIDVIDIPTTKALFGWASANKKQNAGVYDFGFSENMQLQNAYSNVIYQIHNSKKQYIGK